MKPHFKLFNFKTAWFGGLLSLLLLMMQFGNPAVATAAPTVDKPSSLSATLNDSQNEVQLIWSADDSRAHGYLVERSQTSSGGYSQILAVDGNQTSAVDSLNNASGSYYYRVRSYKTVGPKTIYSSYSNVAEVTVTTADTVSPSVEISTPSADVSVTSAQDLDIIASANDDVGVTKVEFYDDTSLIGTDTTNTFSTTLSLDETSNGTHTIHAVAYDAAGNSSQSGSVNVTVDIAGAVDATPETVYPAPVIDGVSVDGDSFVLNWSMPSNPSGTPEGGYDLVIDGVDTADTNRTTNTTATIGGLEAGVAHTFVVEARWTQADPSVFSRSNPAEGTIPAAETDATSPTVVITSPSSDVSVTSAQDLNLIASATDNVAVTKVEFYDGTTLIGSDTTEIYSATLSLDETSNGTHTIHAVAYDAAGNSSQSGSVNVTVDIAGAVDATPETVYPAPVIDGVSVDGDSFVLNWSMPSNPSGTPEGGYDLVIDGVDTADTNRTTNTTATIGGLEAGVAHTFVVEARWTQADPSVFSRSNPAEGTIPVDQTDSTPSTSYPAPVLNSVTADGGDLVLSWTLPSSDSGTPEGGYDIIIDGADTAEQWRTTQTTATITGLEVGVEHGFVVEARWTQADPSVFSRSNEVFGETTSTGSSDSSTDSGSSDPSDYDGPLKVFPGAQGYGVTTPAGRGGEIIHVTNLNDSGTGSFRAAVEASGPRIVVFDISGTIELQSDITISEPYITIAGQTAPAPGIQLRNQTVKIKTHDVLMQHMALRPGDTFVDGDGGSVHALVVYSSAYNCVFDHLSLYWGIDECVGVYGDNLTFSNNIIAEGLDDSYHPEGPHSCGMLVMGGADNVAVVRNLFAHHNHRSPWVKEDTTVYHANNYAYDSRGTFFNFTTDREPYTGQLISIGNVYGKGPDTDIYQGLSVSSNFISAKVYETDSLGDGDSPYGVLSKVVNIDSEYRVDSYPFTPPNYTLLASSLVKGHLIANAGARPAMRDSADARVISNLKNFSGSLIDSPSQVGGWPSYSVNKRVFDEGTNPNGDDDGDGYTNIEETLFSLSAAVEGN
jgi:putative flippase GtrA